MSEVAGNERNGPRNGLFLKILIAVNVTVMGAGVLGGVKMNREQGEMAEQLKSLSGGQAIESARRFVDLEAEAKRTSTEQARRTHRLDTLERDVARNREEIQRLHEELQRLSERRGSAYDGG